MPAYWRFNASAIACADSALSPRLSNGFSVMNTVPALDEFIRPFTDMPGNSRMLSTPGCFIAMSAIVLTTFSVRSSDAPFGSCAKPTRYSLSCAGTKPVGTILPTRMVMPISTA
ncbi:hypothetical protein BUB20358_06689 [Burkholderia ubonensis]|nr:hypothetical protein BUB20358_06689 [Burkholderia ubonensis]